MIHPAPEQKMIRHFQHRVEARKVRVWELYVTTFIVFGPQFLHYTVFSQVIHATLNFYYLTADMKQILKSVYLF